MRGRERERIQCQWKTIEEYVWESETWPWAWHVGWWPFLLHGGVQALKSCSHWSLPLSLSLIEFRSLLPLLSSATLHYLLSWFDMHRLKKVTSSFLFFALLSVCVCAQLWVSLAFLGALGLHASWCWCWWKLLFGKIRISDGGIKKKSEQKAKKKEWVTLRSTSAAICEIDYDSDLYIAEVERNIFESSDSR